MGYEELTSELEDKGFVVSDHDGECIVGGTGVESVNAGILLLSHPSFRITDTAARKDVDTDCPIIVEMFGVRGQTPVVERAGDVDDVLAVLDEWIDMEDRDC